MINEFVKGTLAFGLGSFSNVKRAGSQFLVMRDESMMTNGVSYNVEITHKDIYFQAI